MVIAVDLDRAVQTFLTLVQIDSVTYEEREVIERLAKESEALGLTATNDRTGRDGAGNLHVRVPGSRQDVPPILLCAHTDTVEPGRGVKPVVRDGVIRTDGTTILGADNNRVGLPCSLGVSGGGSDSNTFNGKGLRCVNVRIGMSEIHTVNERIEIEDLGKTCEIALALDGRIADDE